MSKNQTLKEELMTSTNDIKSKTIFRNPVLCCLFLRNYVNHPAMKDIHPEDIEHKTDVDYNVVVQLLKYMACIWAEYEKQFGTDYKN